MIPISEISLSNIAYKKEVLELAAEAKQYLSTLKWCEEIVTGWLAKDHGYILCVFLFEIIPATISGADKNVWVVVGDIAPAYIDVISAPTADDVLECYCYIMEDWINHVKNGKNVAECFPVNLPPTEEHRKMLQTRIELIRSDYIASS